MHGESVPFTTFTFSPTFVPFLDPTLKSGSVVQRVCEHTVSGLNKASDRRPSCCGRRPIFIARPPNPPDPSRKMFKPQTKATVSKLFRWTFAEALWRVGLIRFDEVGKRDFIACATCTRCTQNPLKPPDLHSPTSSTCPNGHMTHCMTLQMSCSVLTHLDLRVSRFCIGSHATSSLLTVWIDFGSKQNLCWACVTMLNTMFLLNPNGWSGKIIGKTQTNWAEKQTDIVWVLSKANLASSKWKCFTISQIDTCNVLIFPCLCNRRDSILSILRAFGTFYS